MESIHVPSEENESDKRLLEICDSLRLDLGRNRQRLMKFLLRKGIKSLSKTLKEGVKRACVNDL
ncbi:hypothetical protein LEP1GSC125_0610 [Leptospira mayottensis 200901122]|uniref:Uncharacterized protein n=1 Tax=Leptospira mayottensis 200901122 TaxID=1193010 RepID=A0AA87MQ21_9LEPT|nr:hypothetical protein LEP1GSC125_0610 [Leptospira mayottensis 200901122]